MKGDLTSWGARFPVSHALKAFPIIKRCHDQGKEWHTNGHTIPLGHFNIDYVTIDGDVKAGCHLVRWTEIENAARQLDLMP